VKLRWLVGAAVATLVVVGAWWWPREPAPTLGPDVVPLGETRQQILPGPDGEPEVWTLTKREGSREELVADDLPEPEPREQPPDPSTDRATDSSTDSGSTDSARALNAQALEAWKHGDVRTAMQHFEAAIDADPDDWVPRSEYARLLVLMTAYEQAQPHLERAAELNPDSPRVWLDLYTYYQRTLQIERSLKARRRAEDRAGGRAIEQDETGLWRLEDDSIFP
jgi:tetratricopeptide (TPR) repeat protein